MRLAFILYLATSGVLSASVALRSGEGSADKPPASTVPIGINLSELSDYSTQWAFVDIFKQSRPWIESHPGKIAYDEHGWPRLQPEQSVQTVMVREIKGHYPAGLYKATFSGPAGVRLDQFDIKAVKAVGRHALEIDVAPADGGLLFTAKGGNVENVHVWMPGYPRGSVKFHPTFRQRLEPFGVIRFMDWQKINNSKLAKWSQRAKPDDARYTTAAGVPVEVMIDLANLLKAHPWFCMPHQADDEFVREFAKMVKDRLDPALKVYVEYSNEVWNGGFEQAEWAQAQGNTRKLGDQAQARFYAARSVEVFQIWEQAFGGRDRLVRVLASQFVNPWLSEQILTWKDAYKHADVLAVAPYFGHEFGDPKEALRTARLTSDELLKRLDAEVSGKNLEDMRKQAKVAQRFHLQLIAYEGGQHLVGGGGAENNAVLTKLFIAANRDPRMADRYRKHLRNWSEAGGGLYVLYHYVGAPGKWGSWGLLEYQDQPVEDAPKYRAAVEFGRKGKETR